MSIITLTTDFGTKDEYVGVMKGVILSICPDARIVDITHDVLPQNISQGAFYICHAYEFFPKGTVHVVVVDPGVGTGRSIVLIKKSGHYFVGPDNGVLAFLLADNKPASVYKVENRKYFLPCISHTFHGRDIMAPVAAHLSLGLPPSELGPEISPADLVKSALTEASFDREKRLAGQIVTIDRFGNLTTNITEKQINDYSVQKDASGAFITIKGIDIEGIAQNYHSVERLKPLAIIGSRGVLEISVNCGNAQAYFNAQISDGVYIMFK